MFNKSTLKPANHYHELEESIASQYKDVVILRSATGVYRLRYIVEGVGVSCLVVGSCGTISSVYTLPAFRRRRIAKQLLAIAKVTLPKPVRHSDNLTPLGKKWRDSVESLH